MAFLNQITGKEDLFGLMLMRGFERRSHAVQIGVNVGDRPEAYQKEPMTVTI